jgi:hypothetical protein
MRERARGWVKSGEVGRKPRSGRFMPRAIWRIMALIAPPPASIEPRTPAIGRTGEYDDNNINSMTIII